jgi:hypothetical protein
MADDLVRTSLSRMLSHDGQIGLSLIARSTLSSNNNSRRFSVAGCWLLANNQRPMTDDFWAPGLLVHSRIQALYTF